MNDTTSSRLEALEMKTAYLEATTAELSSALYEHERRLAALEALVREMAVKVKELARAGLEPLPQDERPPHY